MPKIVDKKKRRAEIARQAMDLFSKKGFGNCTVAEIAECAGVCRGTFYEYFSDKEEVLSEIADQVLGRWEEFIRTEAERSSNPLDALYALVEGGAASLETIRQMTVMYFDLLRLGSTSGSGFAFTRRFRDFLVFSRSRFAELLAEAQRRGQVSAEVEPEVLAAALVAMVDGLLLHRMVLRDRVNPGAVWERMFGYLLEGIG